MGRHVRCEDEAMISFKARFSCFSFLQYLPKKPKKWRMKAWALADSKIGCTCLELEVVHWEGRWSRKWTTWRASCDWITDWPWTRVSCISITFTPVPAFASISIQWVLAAVVLFGWTGEVSQTPSHNPKKKVRLPHIVMMNSLRWNGRISGLCQCSRPFMMTPWFPRNAGVDKHLEGWRQYRRHW